MILVTSVKERMIPMKSPLNIRDIAKAAGVSPMTVSRALSSNSKISEKTKRKVLDVCSRLHYHPNEHFRRISMRRSDTVALIFPELNKSIPGQGGYELYADLNLSSCIRGAQEFLAENGVDILLLEATQAFLSSKRYINMIRGQLLDGALLWGMTDSSLWIQELFQEKLPVVMIQTESSILDCPKVVCDDYTAMSDLVERAVLAGHRRFAVVRSDPTFSIIAERNRAIDDVLSRHRIKPVCKPIGLEASFQKGMELVDDILSSHRDVTCVIAPLGLVGYGCLAELRERKINVPKDMSVIGGDAIMLPGVLVNMSSFFCDFKQVGRRGAESLLRLVNGAQAEPRILIPAPPIEGNTLLAMKIDKKDK